MPKELTVAAARLMFPSPPERKLLTAGHPPATLYERVRLSELLEVFGITPELEELIRSLPQESSAAQSVRIHCGRRSR